MAFPNVWPVSPSSTGKSSHQEAIETNAGNPVARYPTLPVSVVYLSPKKNEYGPEDGAVQHIINKGCKPAARFTSQSGG